jgi:hypothetical protein
MESKWEYIGGHRWSLVDNGGEHPEHVCSVEMEIGKHPVVAYVNRKFTKGELEELLSIVCQTF